MNKFLLLLLASSCASLMGMEMDSQAITIENRTIAIPRQELISLDDNDPYTTRPFSELIEEEHAANKPYLFARIDTQDAPDKKDGKKYSHYVDAAQLNKVLAQNHFNPSESIPSLINRLPIKNIVYYMITKESKEACTQVCTYNDFISPAETRWNQLFRHNQLMVNANNNNPTVALSPSDNANRARLRETASAQQVITHNENIDIEAASGSDSSNRIHSRQQLPICKCIDNCCNMPARAWNKLPRHCFAHGCAAIAACLLDTVCFPIACIFRPCRNPDDRSRNDGFCYCTRKEICQDWLGKTTCCNTDITTSSPNACDAYCGFPT